MNSILTFLLSTALVAAPVPKKIITTDFKGQKTKVFETAEQLNFDVNGVISSIPLEKCSEEIREMFYRKLSQLAKKSINVRDADSMMIEVFTLKKRVSPNSPLGTYVKNITQHLLTLKISSESACKK